MPELTSLFPDVADALDIESVAIVEKDYFVVDLLRLLKEIKPETHTLVFAGGTALSKAGISLNRMSEDIDIKLVPTENFMQNGRDKRRKIRKEIVQIITDFIHNSDIFSLDNENARITRDEYRYNEISVRYPQTFAQVPCLRPFIKLELMESTLLEHPRQRCWICHRYRRKSWRWNVRQNNQATTYEWPPDAGGRERESRPDSLRLAANQLLHRPEQSWPELTARW